MDLKEIKRIAAFARKSGIKTLKMNGLELEFHESAQLSKPKAKRLAMIDSESRPAPPHEPTLDEINQYIYTDEAG